MRCPPPARRAARGIAAIEFAIVLPLLALLLFMLADLARAIQAKTILLNISREGANLSARSTSDLSGSSQGIMNALAATTPPLDMPARGMIYITKIMGHAAGPHGSVRNIVLEQYRWNAGAQRSAYQPDSQVWQCASWMANGACGNIGKNDAAPGANLMQGQLADGELIYAVETFYHFDMLFGAIGTRAGQAPLLGPDLYSMTVF
ncbi:TadE/TadG family type IV pilus assembly protein [Janthinobacterium rivuli]|uniref:TadE/TadG family type IV pilus assembly protein n=1 Tax=Janthinobacterium rivuli TaxID=2751478 RepID=UPI00383A95F4